MRRLSLKKTHLKIKKPHPLYSGHGFLVWEGGRIVIEA